MADWVTQALNWLEAGTPCALVSLLAIEGSTPREAGVRMVVTADLTVGSIGGGNLEFQAIGQARLALREQPGTWRIQDYPLGPLLAQCCGGRVRVMIERLRREDATWLRAILGLDAFVLQTRLFETHAERQLGDGQAEPLRARGPTPSAGAAFCEQIGVARTPVLMCGAGHVGVAVSRILKSLPFEVTWLDTRDEAADVEGVVQTKRADMISQAGAAPGLVIILTHDHQLDYELSVAALHGPSRFIGVIGSQTKRARFWSRLTKDGFDAQSLSRLQCPIGLEGLRGKAPEIIAVSIAAKLLLVSQSGRTQATDLPAPFPPGGIDG